MRPRTTDLPTFKQVKDLFDYDEFVGLLIWKVTTGRAIAGRPAGGIDKSTGYHRVRCCGNLWVSHFIIWLWKTGKWPEHYLDHEDGNPANNVFSNLRPATQSQNMANSKRPSHNKSGYKGVHFSAAAGQYVAQIRVNGKTKHIGCYATAELAHEAYMVAAHEAFGEFAFDGARGPVVERKSIPKRAHGRLTAEEAWEYFDYDWNSGALRWKKSNGFRGQVGDLAGRLNSDGYIRVGIFGRQYPAHVLAYLIVNGEYPKGRLDHWDNCRSNNAYSNIRECTQIQNLANTRLGSTNTTGFKGVSMLPNGKFGAWITINQKSRNLGSYDTAELAHEAYRKAALEEWDEFAKFE